MSEGTRLATDQRVAAAVDKVIRQAQGEMRARELTFRTMMTERQQKHEAGVAEQLAKLGQELGALIREVERNHNRRLEQLERPWWKKLLGRSA